MAKKSSISKENKKYNSIIEYKEARNWVKNQIKRSSSYRMRVRIHHLLQEFPRNSSVVRKQNRCSITGRPRSVYSYFGLSRHWVRKMAHDGLLPGVVKSSW